MAKSSSNKTNSDTLAQLTALVDRVAPGAVTLAQSRFTLDGKKGYELTLDTRESKISWHADTLAEVVDDTHDEPAPDEDPIRPAWRRLTRMQREVVTRTLEKLAARHMARAAAAKIASDASAFAEYELADAFHAACEALQFVDVDEDGMLVMTQKLEGKPPIPRPIVPRTTPLPSTKPRRRFHSPR